MAARVLILSAFAAFVYAKAIVTNQCPCDVYIWSVPQTGFSNVTAFRLKPGGCFEEPWHYGSAINPGIAIKISSTEDGIQTQKDEVDFAYTVDVTDASKIWVGLSNVRGDVFGNNVTLHTCHGARQGLYAPTRQCNATDDVELTLCGTVRTTPGKDTKPLNKIFDCYSESGHGQSKPPTNTVCTNKPQCKPKHCETSDHPSCTTPRPKHQDDCVTEHPICSARVTYPRQAC